MAGNAADDAVAMRNLLRLVRCGEAGFAVCAAMRCSTLASLSLSPLATPQLTVQSPMSSDMIASVSAITNKIGARGKTVRDAVPHTEKGAMAAFGLPLPTWALLHVGQQSEVHRS
jgi:hypothetical protein